MTSNALAFNVDGFFTGMTLNQLKAEAHDRGLDVWQGPYQNWELGKRAQAEIDGGFVFCRGGLVIYMHSVSFDEDYVPLLRSLIAANGQPRRVETKASFTEGVYMHEVVMAWYRKSDRIELSFTPEVRDGNGKVRFRRSADIDYATKNACWTKF